MPIYKKVPMSAACRSFAAEGIVAAIAVVAMLAPGVLSAPSEARCANDGAMVVTLPGAGTPGLCPDCNGASALGQAGGLTLLTRVQSCHVSDLADNGVTLRMAKP